MCVCVCMHWIAEVALTIIISLMIIKKACHQYLNLHFWTISPQQKTSISFWSCSVLIVPLYKRYKQTAFALHVNGYLQERECVCAYACALLTAATSALGGEHCCNYKRNKALETKNTWKEKKTYKPIKALTNTLSHAQTCTLIHTYSILALRFVQQSYIPSL